MALWHACEPHHERSAKPDGLDDNNRTAERKGTHSIMPLSTWARIIWAKRSAFFAVFGVVAVLSIAFAFLVSPIYRADALLLVTEGRSHQEGVRYPDFLRYKINSQLFIIESEDVLRGAIAAVGAEKLFPDLADGFNDRFEGRGKDASANEAAYLKAKKLLNIATEKDTQVLRLSFTHEDPELAARFLNAIIDVFLKRQAELSGNSEAPAFFRAQVKRYRSDYDRASLELSNFSKSHSTYSVEQQRKLALERRDEVTSALATTKGTILEKESQAAKLQDTLTQLKRHVGFPSEVRGPKYNPPPAAETDRSADLPSGDPPLLLVRVYQDTAQTLVTLNASIAGLHALEENQRAALTSVDAELVSLSSVEAEFDRLKREVDQAATYLEAHTKRAAEAQIDADWDASEKLASVKVVQRASVPIKPAFPQKLLFISLGLLVGLIAAAAVSVALHMFPEKFPVPGLRAAPRSPDFAPAGAPRAPPSAFGPQRPLVERRGSLR
jgi:succinoglycan biosynthesis transport protein ExoP